MIRGYRRACAAIVDHSSGRTRSAGPVTGRSGQPGAPCLGVRPAVFQIRLSWLPSKLARRNLNGGADHLSAGPAAHDEHRGNAAREGSPEKLTRYLFTIPGKPGFWAPTRLAGPLFPVH